MKVIESTLESAMVSMTAFEVVVLLTAVTQLEDLSQLRLAYLDQTRQPEVDALYGDLFRLAEVMRIDSV